MEKKHPIESLVDDDDQDDGEHLKMDEESHPIMTKPNSIIKPVTVSQKFVTLCLAVGLGLALFALVVLIIVFGVTFSTLKSPSSSGGGGGSCDNCSNVCLTDSCIQAAAFILGNIDRSVDPCKDFYNFTCGAWAQKTVIPTGSGSISMFAQLAERNIVALKKILDQGDDGGVNSVRKLLDLYQSCLDTEQINALGAEPILQVINRTGGWSLLNMSNDSTWDINSVSFITEKVLGNPAFFTVAVGVDDKNSSNHIIEVAQSGLSLPSRDSYLDNRTSTEALDALKTLFVTVLSLLNPDGDASMFEEAAQDLVEFETKLAEIFLSDVSLRDIDITYNKVNLSTLSTLFPEYNWVENVRALFQWAGNLSVTGDEPVIVRTPSYLQNLTELFQFENNTTIENYVKWQLVKEFLPFMSEDFTDAYNTFTLLTRGKGEGERYKSCIEVVQEVLPIALARPYSQLVLPQGTKGNVSEMIEAVKAAFVERLETINTWLDEETKAASKEKVDAITKMVAFPDQLFNDSYLDGLYADLEVSGDDFFGNIKHYIQLSTKRNLKRLQSPVDTSEWLNAPTQVNAYYNPPYNQFVFLEGILNLPFFEAGWPDYLKYGALGTVIGHELTHGFDDQGQRYDKDGNLRSWWSSESIKAFKNRQKCFAEQYSQYEMFGFHINGYLTLGENIADNGGIKAAFQAYKDVVKQKGQTPPSLPSLTSFTDEQMFFIAFGQVWCAMFTPEYIDSLIKSNPHSPGPYRVIGSLVNSQDFADAFQCSVGSRMNPPVEEKCLMW